MRCEEYESHFQLFIDDELTPQERSTFEEHLRSCSDCRQRLNSLVHMTSLVGRMKEHKVPISFNYRVLKELGFAVIPRWSRIVSVASALLIGGWVGLGSVWVSRPGAGRLPELVKFVLGLPERLVVIGKALNPLLVLLKAGAVVLRSLGGVYLITTLSFAFLTTLVIWWLLNRRLKPIRVLSLI